MSNDHVGMSEAAHVEKTDLAGPPPGMTTPEQIAARKAAEQQAQEGDHASD